MLRVPTATMAAVLPARAPRIGVVARVVDGEALRYRSDEDLVYGAMREYEAATFDVDSPVAVRVDVPDIGETVALLFEVQEQPLQGRVIRPALRDGRHLCGHPLMPTALLLGIATDHRDQRDAVVGAAASRTAIWVARVHRRVDALLRLRHLPWLLADDAEAVLADWRIGSH